MGWEFEIFLKDWLNFKRPILLHNKGNLYLSLGFHFFFFFPHHQVPFVFLTLPKAHHNSLKNFVETNCLPLFIFGFKFSKAPQSKHTKNRSSAVMVFKTSPWLSVGASWVLGCLHSAWESWNLYGGIDSVEYQVMLR